MDSFGDAFGPTSSGSLRGTSFRDKSLPPSSCDQRRSCEFGDGLRVAPITGSRKLADARLKDKLSNPRNSRMGIYRSKSNKNAGTNCSVRRCPRAELDSRNNHANDGGKGIRERSDESVHSHDSTPHNPYNVFQNSADHPENSTNLRVIFTTFTFNTTQNYIKIPWQIRWQNFALNVLFPWR